VSAMRMTDRGGYSGGCDDDDGGQQRRRGRATTVVAMDDSSDGGCGNKRWRRYWLSSVLADSDWGNRKYNREGGRAGEDGGETSEIFDYSVAPGIVTFCRDPLKENVTTRLYIRRSGLVLTA
jgi:hypothetical protein